MNKRSPLELILPVALCVAGFLLNQIQSNARNRGLTDPFTASIRSAIQPVATPLRIASERVSDWRLGTFSGTDLVAENRRLKAQLQALAGYQEQMDAMRREVEGLQKFQGFGEVPGKARVPATIIGYYPRENLLTLDVGMDRGVKAGAPVIAPMGLVGTVQAVEAHRCQVQLLQHPELKIGATDISRKPASAGLLRLLSVSFWDPKAPVDVGDLIVTSGFSDKIPRGIVIGRVILVEDSQSEGTRRALVDPAVSIGEIREVQVLT